ncbi:MAG: hypothetical protein JXO48_04205, partial [Deltaproteobacteria bacterium]|nr:hypothetical protein [Deltaproteobacteria bacterium]
MKTKSFFKKLSNEKGAVLVVALLILAALVIIGTTAYIHASTEVKISRNYKAEKQAFYDAEAGVEYIGKKLEQDLNAGNIDLTADQIALSYTTPGHFFFDPPAVLTSLGSNRFRFRVVGHADPDASRTIDVDIATRRKSVFEFGFFADGTVDLKASSGMYSYDSRITPNPTPADSTNMCDVGSNTEIIVRMDTLVDGDTALGEDVLGVDGIWTEVGVPIINGDKGTPVDRVDPDPLGARGGDLAN